jgi:hypothetical protein
MLCFKKTDNSAFYIEENWTWDLQSSSFFVYVLLRYEQLCKRDFRVLCILSTLNLPFDNILLAQMTGKKKCLDIKNLGI